jgi:hypothetical protein
VKSTIWKYHLEVEDLQQIEMPVGAQVLAVEVQNGQPCLWAKVDPTKLNVVCKIATVGTGHPANHAEGLQYIGTYQLHGGNFVGHVFWGVV